MPSSRRLLLLSGLALALILATPSSAPADMHPEYNGFLGSRELIEPLIVLSGGVDAVASFYRQTIREYLERCAAAGLGDRSGRSPLPGFIDLLDGKRADPNEPASAQ